MTQSYVISAAASDLAAFTGTGEEHALPQSNNVPGPSSTLATSIRPGNNYTFAFDTPVGDPGAGGTGNGTFTIRIHPISGSAGALNIQPQIAHLTSSGTVLEVYTSIPSQTWSVGTTITWTVNPSMNAGWIAGDRLQIRFVVNNTDTKGGATSITIETDNPAVTIDTPFGSAPTTLNKSASDTGAISATSTSSVSSTGATSDGGTVAVAEASAVSIIAAKSTSDTGAVSVTESSSVAVTWKAISTTDTTAMSVASSTNLTRQGQGQESQGLAVAESSSTSVTINSADTVAVAVIDAASNNFNPMSQFAGTQTGITRVGYAAPIHNGSGAITIPYQSTQGNLLILTVSHGLATGTTIIDDGGNTWSLAGSTDSVGSTSQREISVFYCLNANAITQVSVDGGQSYENVWLEEFSGVGGFRTATAIEAPVASTTPDPATVAGVTVGDLVYGVCAYFETNGTLASGVSTGYALATTFASGNQVAGSAYSTTVSGTTGPQFSFGAVATKPGEVTLTFTPATTVSTSQSSDQNLVSASESSSVAVTVSTRNDTAAMSVVETSALLKTIVANDSVAVSANDISGLGSTLPGQESISLGITDTSSTFIDQPTTDASSLAVSETVDIYVTVASQEVAGIAVDDSGAVQLGFSTTDAGSVAVGETSAVEISGTLIKSAEDTGSLAVAESTSKFVSLSSTDTGSIATAETTGTSGNGGVTSNDSATIAIDDASSLFKQISSEDTGAVSVGESFAFGVITFGSTDTASLSVVEDGIIGEGYLSSDTVSVSVAETSSVSISGGKSKASADSAALAIAESSAVKITVLSITSSDVASLTVDEATSGYVVASATEINRLGASEGTEFFRDIATAETVPLGVADQAVLGSFQTFESGDSGGIGVIDVSATSKAEGFVTLAVNDSATIAIIDHSNNWIVGGQHIPITFASNSEHGTIISTEAERGDMHFNSTSERVIRFE